MNKCIKVVGGNSCNGSLIKYGKVKGRQRYRCKDCNITQMSNYIHRAYKLGINQQIINYVKEGCGIRSIARLLNITSGTVISRIVYEVDELRTYIKHRQEECWVIYAPDKKSGTVVDLRVGKRTKDNIRKITDSLL